MARNKKHHITNEMNLRCKLHETCMYVLRCRCRAMPYFLERKKSERGRERESNRTKEHIKIKQEFIFVHWEMGNKCTRRTVFVYFHISMVVFKSVWLPTTQHTFHTIVLIVLIVQWNRTKRISFSGYGNVVPRYHNISYWWFGMLWSSITICWWPAPIFPHSFPIE